MIEISQALCDFLEEEIADIPERTIRIYELTTETLTKYIYETMENPPEDLNDIDSRLFKSFFSWQNDWLKDEDEETKEYIQKGTAAVLAKFCDWSDKKHGTRLEAMFSDAC